MQVEKWYNKLTFLETIKEFLWNSLDADADNINIIFNKNHITWIDSIEIVDDGVGIDYDDIDDKKWDYWYSNKALDIKSKKWRFYHWKKWIGRYAWLAIGSDVKWRTVYTNKIKNIAYNITISEVNLQTFKLNEKEDIQETSEKTGTTVTIKNLKNKKIKGLRNLEADIISEFAYYMKIYESQWIQIKIDWVNIDFAKGILGHKKYENVKIVSDDIEYKFKVEFFHWNKKGIKSRNFCLHDGIPIYTDRLTGLNEQSFWHSVFITATFFNEDDVELQVNNTIWNAVQKKVKELLLNWFLKDYYKWESEKVIDQLVEENLYPYSDIKDNPLKEAEKNLFDITIWTLVTHSWSNKILWNWNTKRKGLIISLLKKSIEKWGDDILETFQSVLDLDKWELQDFTYMIKKHWLSSTIKMSKIISNKISFLQEIDEMLYWKFKSETLERKHLHKILEKELWIFWDGYNLWTSDEPFRNLLSKHKEVIWRDSIKYDDKDLTQERPDLFLYQQFASTKKNKFDNLIVELKRPSKSLWESELSQIKNYARQIVSDNSFDKKNNYWNFILVTSDYTEAAEFEMNSKRDNIYMEWDNYIVKVYKWSELLSNLRWRYDFVKQQLEKDAFKYNEELSYIENEYSDINQEVKDRKNSK